MTTYEAVSLWGDELLDACCASESSGYVVDVLRNSDLTTPKGIKDLSDVGVAHLQKNLVPGVYDAMCLWQATQCLKKFRYGCAASPEEMQQGWIDRNARLQGVRLPWWLRDDMRALLAPLGPAFESTESQGRFGNGAVAEGLTVHARYNSLGNFPYNARRPDDIGGWSPSLSGSARLCCVPKDMLKLRSITVEPADASFLQQYYRSRLIQACAMVLPTSSAIPAQLYGGGPEIQRGRALAGSASGALATIDLSDASDSISIYDVVDVFPANIVAALERARSPYVTVGSTCYRCHMYAGMGNATTFIVESTYFWALFTAICRRLRVFTPVSVFGDDIVLSTRAATHPLFSDYVASAHVTLNTVKSGVSAGPGFREACGLAAYQGVELPLLRIPGFRLSKPEEMVSFCSLLSDALEPNTRYAPFVRTLSIKVGREFCSRYAVPVLPQPLVEAGVYVADPSETIGPWSYRARWNPELQHPQVKVRVLTPLFVTERRYQHVTVGEALGILNRQLRTVFADAAVGFHSRLTTFCYPSRGMQLKSRWVTAWGSDATLIGLVSE